MRLEDGYYYWEKGNKTDRLGKWFGAGEFDCSCENEDCKEQKISKELIDRLEWLREACNSPMRVHSGFRCAKHQQEIRESGVSTVVASGTSTHEIGNAADVSCSKLITAELLKLAEIKFKSIGLARSFIHVDLRDDKIRRWNY